jgi:hypothetical protein
MSGLTDFVTAQHVAERAVLRMAAMAVFARAAAEDPEVLGLGLTVGADGFGAPSVDVELLGQGGMPVGGFSL